MLITRPIMWRSVFSWRSAVAKLMKIAGPKIPLMKRKKMFSGKLLLDP